MLKLFNQNLASTSFVQPQIDIEEEERNQLKDMLKTDKIANLVDDSSILDKSKDDKSSNSDNSSNGSHSDNSDNEGAFNI